jgi:hypothetical protein
MSEEHTISQGTIPDHIWDALKALGLTERQAYRAVQIIQGAKEWPKKPRFGFVRTTHDIDGNAKEFPEASEKAWAFTDAGFVGHMLFKTPSSLQEIRMECHKYAKDHGEEPLSTHEICVALVVLLEHGMAAVKPLEEKDAGTE